MTGHKAGSLKHSIAENIVKDYQNNIADRNLDMEIHYKGNTAAAGNANINGYRAGNLTII